jgi:hypothetical protein
VQSEAKTFIVGWCVCWWEDEEVRMKIWGGALLLAVFASSERDTAQGRKMGINV